MKQTDMDAWIKRSDARDLEVAVRIIRRRKVNPDGMSRAAFCRVLLSVADELRAEARQLEADD